MKKLAAYLLLGIVLVATFNLSCADDACSEQEIAHDGQQNEGADCSPFSSCGSCNNLFFPATHTFLNSISYLGPEHNISKYLGLESCYRSPFWQPPKSV